MKGTDRNGHHLGPVCDVEWKAQESNAGCWSKIDLTIDAI